MSDIFSKTKGWVFTELDSVAEVKFQKILNSTQKSLPPYFYQKESLKHNDLIISSQLYRHLSTIPKGVCHHCHYDCNEDLQFYQKFVIKNPNVYVTQDLKTYQMGTKKQALENKWISLNQFKQKFTNEEQFLKGLLNITSFNKDQISNLTGDSKAWTIFQQRINAFFPILNTIDFAKDYFVHINKKFIKNGYTRMQYRVFIPNLNEYDNDGNLIKTHGIEKFKEVCEEGLKEIQKDYPNFTVGFIAFGLKMFNAEQNQQIFTNVCKLKWDKVIGLDFVQQQDKYGQTTQYDPTTNRVINQFPQSNLKKVYHAGETRSFSNNNVQQSIKAGSVRIGHGINIVLKPYLKEVVSANVCFQLCPVSNLFMGYTVDARCGTGNILMNLGVPVTINPDDPSKFNCLDSTTDYFIAAVAYNWGLKHLKLAATHSVNHAVCSQKEREQIRQDFNLRWNNWINELIKI